MRQEIERLEKELAELTKKIDALKNPKFKEGDWIYHTNTDRVHKITKETAISPKLWGSSAVNVDVIALNEQYFRKATPEEIETALIKEAERRGFKKGVNVNLKNIYPDPVNDTFIISNYPEYIYNSKDDYLEVSSNHGRNTIYKQGKWAEIVENTTKFFEWDVTDKGKTVKIGCSSYSKEFLNGVYDALGYINNQRTVRELRDELETLEFIEDHLPF